MKNKNLNFSLLVFAILLEFTLQVKRGKCVLGKLQFNSSCYQVIFHRKQHADAKAACESRGGYLVEIGSAEEQYYLIRAITELLRHHPTDHIQFWTGGSRISSTWTWHSRVDGASAAMGSNGKHRQMKKTDFQDWRPFEPSDEAMEPSATMKLARNIWGWNDVYSDRRFCLRFICEKPMDKSLKACEKKWHKFQDHCYLFSNREHLHARAKRNCQKKESHLVSINSKEENEFIKKQIIAHSLKGEKTTYEEWWIGAERFGGAGGQHWLWDETMQIEDRYSKWLFPPNHSDRKLPLAYVVLIFYGGKWWWTTELRWRRLPSICESEPDKIVVRDHYELACYGGFKMYRRRCYLFQKNYQTRHEAEVSCMNQGGRLVSVNSELEMKYLSKNIDGFGSMKYDKWWTGGLYTGFKWTWSDEYQHIQGSDFNAWMSGEPNNFGGNEKHISLRMDFGEWGWNDVSSSGIVRIPHICEFPAQAFNKSEYDKECKTDEAGDEYVGNINRASDGSLCQRWDVQWPNKHSYIGKNFPDQNLYETSNFCRNPDRRPEGPWCFLADKRRGHWMFCDVPLCQKIEAHAHTDYDDFV